MGTVQTWFELLRTKKRHSSSAHALVADGGRGEGGGPRRAGGKCGGVKVAV